MDTVEVICDKIKSLISKEVDTVTGTASFGTLIKSFNILDPQFNHAFSAGIGAKFDDNGNLIGVDGFGLFKYLNYETHPILKMDNWMIILKLEGELMYDKYTISILKSVDESKEVNDEKSL